ncbi:hypothetical protein ANN_04959 [Periplaneta americana]|uniref:Uncharacterized protein n=1 Tax=Periplaneta americana TaxID=6978 RepID=A0ABQ8T9S7_PERAM|nr:hypothetical protein ANN_04959 [Periplaneta americana]
MAGLCNGGNEHPGFLKAVSKVKYILCRTVTDCLHVETRSNGALHLPLHSTNRTLSSVRSELHAFLCPGPKPGHYIAGRIAVKTTFEIGRNGKIPIRQTILNWVRQFRSTASVGNKRPPSSSNNERTPENVRVAAAFQLSPQRSSRRHSVALHSTPSTVRHILNEDLKLHPFKINVSAISHVSFRGCCLAPALNRFTGMRLFFLWGYLKEKAYAHCSHSIQELKDYIREEIRRIPENVLRKVMDSVRERAEICLASNGTHLSDILIK